jgi:hypothetical protein
MEKESQTEPATFSILSFVHSLGISLYSSFIANWRQKGQSSFITSRNIRQTTTVVLRIHF